ncbi:hypothetical protein E2542_SST29517 [Spatholobus suberectus]|nr:hypothetical protein E2542_SST29517 [Spatholobus suberectus]
MQAHASYDSRETFPHCLYIFVYDPSLCLSSFDVFTLEIAPPHPAMIQMLRTELRSWQIFEYCCAEPAEHGFWIKLDQSHLCSIKNFILFNGGMDEVGCLAVGALEDLVFLCHS